MRPAAFLFDLDGTLIESERLWAEAIVEWLADNGQTTSVEAFAPIIFGHSWLDIYAAIYAHFPALPKLSPAAVAKELRPRYERRAVNPVQLVVQGSVAFFRKAARLAPCVIVSGSPHADVQDAAELCGIADQVRFVLGAEDYGRGKPAPDGFLKAAEMLDVDASECVVVEDSTAGVAAGRAAGMRVVGVDRNTLCPQNLAGCEWLVHDLSELDVEAVFGDDKED